MNKQLRLYSGLLQARSPGKSVPYTSESVTITRRKPNIDYPDPQALRAAELILASNADQIVSAAFGFDQHISNTAVFFQPPHFEQTIDIEAAFKSWSDAVAREASRCARSQSLSPTFRQSHGPSLECRLARAAAAMSAPYGPSDLNRLRCPGDRRVPGFDFQTDLSGIERRLTSLTGTEKARYLLKMNHHVAASVNSTYQDFAKSFDAASEKALRSHFMCGMWRYAEEVWYDRLRQGRAGKLPRGMARRLKEINKHKNWVHMADGRRHWRDGRFADATICSGAFTTWDHFWMPIKMTNALDIKGFQP